MAFWLMYFKGKKRWNYTEAKLVRAKDEATARRMFGDETEWSIEKVEDDDNDPDVILSHFVGDNC